METVRDVGYRAAEVGGVVQKTAGGVEFGNGDIYLSGEVKLVGAEGDRVSGYPVPKTMPPP